MKLNLNVLILNFFFFIGLTSVYAQGVGLNATGASPHASAGLDVDFTDKGFLPPRMTTVERDAIANPARGLHIYNTDTDCVNIYVGSTWKQICPDCDFSLPIVGSNGPICEGDQLDLTASLILGGTYQWAGPNGFTSTQQNPSISNATAAASGAYSLQVTVGGCTGNTVSTAVTVTATPQAPATGSNSPVCEGSTLNLTASNIVGATYSWTGPNGFSSAQQNPSIANATTAAAGTYNVVASVNGCPGASGTTAVTIDVIPAAPVASAASNVGAASFDANWNASGGATAYFLDVATDNNFTAFVSGYNNLNVGNVTTYTVSGLAEFTTYYYRVWADHNCGTSAYSDTTSVTTSGTLVVTFTNCSQTGRTGPSQSQCNSAYSGSLLDGNVTVNGGFQDWVVPVSGTYKITAYGAEGGWSEGTAGRGAVIEGVFSLTAGQTLTIVVGQQGSATSGTSALNSGGGGGGASFVKHPSGYPLIVAGGGGGAYCSSTTGDQPGQDGEMQTSGGSNTSNSGGSNGAGGVGSGGTSIYEGSGGAGWSGAGQAGYDGATGGASLSTTAMGGVASNTYLGDGGFGGGGGTSRTSSFARGAGGGGYSGGGGSGNCGSGKAGGGGSFIYTSVSNPATSNGSWSTTGSEPHSAYSGAVSNLNTWNTGHGKVVIELQ